MTSSNFEADNTPGPIHDDPISADHNFYLYTKVMAVAR